MLNKGNDYLSAGTRLNILGPGSADRMLKVCLRSWPSIKLRERGFPQDGVFEIDEEYVTPIKSRKVLIDV